MGIRSVVNSLLINNNNSSMCHCPVLSFIKYKTFLLVLRKKNPDHICGYADIKPDRCKEMI